MSVQGGVRRARCASMRPEAVPPFPRSGTGSRRPDAPVPTATAGMKDSTPPESAATRKATSHGGTGAIEATPGDRADLPARPVFRIAGGARGVRVRTAAADRDRPRHPRQPPGGHPLRGGPHADRGGQGRRAHAAHRRAAAGGNPHRGHGRGDAPAGVGRGMSQRAVPVRPGDHRPVDGQGELPPVHARAGELRGPVRGCAEAPRDGASRSGAGRGGAGRAGAGRDGAGRDDLRTPACGSAAGHGPGGGSPSASRNGPRNRS